MIKLEFNEFNPQIYDLGSKIDDTNELKRLKVDGKIIANYKVFSYDSLSHAKTFCPYISLK